MLRDVVQKHASGSASTADLPASTEDAWIDVIQKMDQVYADLVQSQTQLESKNVMLEEAQAFIDSVLSAMTDVLTDKQKSEIAQHIPAQRFGTPEDIAAAAVYLASPEAGYMTGQTLHVNGGMAMV